MVINLAFSKHKITLIFVNARPSTIMVCKFSKHFAMHFNVTFS